MTAGRLALPASAVVFAAGLVLSLALDYTGVGSAPILDWLVLLAGLTAAAIAGARALRGWAGGRPGWWKDLAASRVMLLALLLWFVRFPTTQLEWEEIRRGWEQRRRDLDGIRRTWEQRRRGEWK